MKAFGSAPSGLEKHYVGINPGANLRNIVPDKIKIIF